MLQARQWEAPYSFLQSCKLIWAGGEQLRALQELDNAIIWSDSKPGTIDLTGSALPSDDLEDRKIRGKVLKRTE